jgi:hypothetical protein
MVRRAVRLLLVVMTMATMTPACSDDDTVVDAGGTTTSALVPAATLTGVITEVTPLEPATTDCTPVEDLEPDAAISSDEPPPCVDAADAPLGTILVEEDPAADTGTKIIFTVGPQTRLERATDPTAGSDDRTEIAFDDLSPGTEAVVGYSGAVADSYPGQAAADSVLALVPES